MLVHVVAVFPSFVVISKPSGMLTVPGRGDDKSDSVQTRLMRMFPDVRGMRRITLATCNHDVVC